MIHLRPLRDALDSDAFRDRHERAVRAHILEGPADHRCDDLCSGSVIDRLVGKQPTNEYPLQPQYAPDRERVLRILNDSGSYVSMEAVADAIFHGADLGKPDDDLTRVGA